MRGDGQGHPLFCSRPHRPDSHPQHHGTPAWRAAHERNRQAPGTNTARRKKQERAEKNHIRPDINLHTSASKVKTKVLNGHSKVLFLLYSPRHGTLHGGQSRFMPDINGFAPHGIRADGGGIARGTAGWHPRQAQKTGGGVPRLLSCPDASRVRQCAGRRGHHFI